MKGTLTKLHFVMATKVVWWNVMRNYDISHDIRNFGSGAQDVNCRIISVLTSGRCH
jgi:hypothetical protein